MGYDDDECFFCYVRNNIVHNGKKNVCMTCVEDANHGSLNLRVENVLRNNSQFYTVRCDICDNRKNMSFKLACCSDHCGVTSDSDTQDTDTEDNET